MSVVSSGPDVSHRSDPALIIARVMVAVRRYSRQENEKLRAEGSTMLLAPPDLDRPMTVVSYVQFVLPRVGLATPLRTNLLFLEAYARNNGGRLPEAWKLVPVLEVLES